MKEEIQLYLDSHLNFMPVPPPSYRTAHQRYDGKTPFKGLEWRSLQTTPLKSESLVNHFTQRPDDNVAIILGHLSNMTVLDFDVKGHPNPPINELISFIAKATPTPPPISLTGGGGFHVFYQFENVKNSQELTTKELFPDLEIDPPLKIDIKSDGGYIIAPPSLHKSGKNYIWHPAYPLEFPLPKMPELFRKHLQTKGENKPTKDWEALMTNPILEGQRHNTILSIAGLLFLHLPPQLWLSTVYPLINSWNKLNVSPPLSDKEVKSILDSLAREELKKFDV